jgi:hypothetical protein
LGGVSRDAREIRYAALKKSPEGTMPAPIALFAYRRPDHLRQTLAALQRNPEAARSLLYVFSDAAKDEGAAGDVAQVREILRGARGFHHIELVERDQNVGLARNITSGVTQVLGLHDDVIVIEDDLVTSPHFCRFVNEGLSFYRDEPRVANITGYCYPVFRALPETFLVRASVSWGWATWRDRWAHFNADGQDLRRRLLEQAAPTAFDFDGSVRYMRMLEDQIAGHNDSWAIRWYASCFLRNELVLFPGRSLVRNIGNDGSHGTHTRRRTTVYDVTLSPTPIELRPIAVAENLEARAAFREFFGVTQRRFSRLRGAWRRLKGWRGNAVLRT